MPVPEPVTKTRLPSILWVFSMLNAFSNLGIAAHYWRYFESELIVGDSGDAVDSVDEALPTTLI